MAGFDNFIQGKPDGEVQVEEKPVEESKDIKDTPPEKPVETTEKTGEGTSGEASKEIVDPLAWVKEKYNLDVEDEDGLGEFFQKAQKAEDYANKLTDYEKEFGKIDDLRKQLEDVDPSKLFASEKDYVAQQLKIKYPDKNPDVLQKIVDGVDKLDDLTALAYNELLDDPGFPGGVDAMKEHLKKKYFGEDEEEDDFAKKQVRIDASHARTSLRKFADVEVPKFKSAEDRQHEYEQKVNDLRDKWSPLKKDIIPAKIEEEIAGNKFEFTLDDDLNDFADVFIAASGLEPNEENKALVAEELQKEALWRNRDKILEAYGNQIKSQVLKKADEETGNDKPPNTAERTDDQTVKKPSGIDQFISNRVPPGTVLG